MTDGVSKLDSSLEMKRSQMHDYELWMIDNSTALFSKALLKTKAVIMNVQFLPFKSFYFWQNLHFGKKTAH